MELATPRGEIEGDVPFPEVFVINLEQRVDRWTSIEETCRVCGLDAKRVSAERSSPGWIGCGRSHQKIIKAAKERGLPWILILEDDATFDNKGIRRFRELLPYLWENRNSWERFSGGPTFFFNAAQPWIHIFDIHRQLFHIQGTATHFDLINSAAYDRILAWNPERGRAIDIFYCDLAAEGFRNICTYPHIATQSSSASDIWGDNLTRDYSHHYHASNLKLKECLVAAAPLAAGMLELSAIHSHWRGVLCVSENGNFLWHKGTSSIGTYERRDETLVAHWYDFPQDSFIDVSGNFISAEIISDAPRLETLTVVVSGGAPAILEKATIRIPKVDFSVQLRMSTTDVYVYRQVFVAREYDSVHLPQDARNIVDLGANIGLSTIFLALKYPNAAVLSVEPDLSNFSQLLINTAPLGHRVQALMAAAWSRDGVLGLVTEDIDGRSHGADAIQVAESRELWSRSVPCFSIASLLKNAKFESVDILKVDIEGAERDIFANQAGEWLTRVGMIIIETHDRFIPGTETVVRDAIKSTFEELPRSGELLFFRRIAI